MNKTCTFRVFHSKMIFFMESICAKDAPSEFSWWVVVWVHHSIFLKRIDFWQPLAVIGDQSLLDEG